MITLYIWDDGSHLDDTSSRSIEIALELLLALFLLFSLDFLDLFEFLDLSLYWAALVDKEKQGYCDEANSYEDDLKLISFPKSRAIERKLWWFRAELELLGFEKRLLYVSVYSRLGECGCSFVFPCFITLKWDIVG